MADSADAEEDVDGVDADRDVSDPSGGREGRDPGSTIDAGEPRGVTHEPGDGRLDERGLERLFRAQFAGLVHAVAVMVGEVDTAADVV